MHIINVVSLKKIYLNGNVEVRALNNINLSIEEGEFITIIGPSGSGKSTLLNMLGGLDYPTGGIVSVNGKILAEMDNEELAVFRRRNIGFVFQNYNLIPSLNIYENIVLPIKLDNGSIDEKFVGELTDGLEISREINMMPDELSGGQQQRVAIARALITRPTIVLADEPTGNLDSGNSEKVIKLMKDMARKYHQTMAVITHNERIANMADRIIRIEDGMIISEGKYLDDTQKR
ncbi:ABC transporter ATP-binding protein [Coprococcus catus]|uniref:ABC transporter ATP-binding protein n=1 Tax=Coprococcus catus TaxID=116085 RepID=UPI003CFCF642